MSDQVIKKERGLIHEVDPDYSETIVASDVVKLDIACGDRKQEGFVGVDKAKLPGVDIVHNLESYPWPFEDNSIFEIRCSHYVEHTKDLKKFMEECYRILIPNGLMVITGPYYTSIRAWMDFTHIRPLSENTFLYFNQPWLISQLLKHYNVNCDFDINAIQYIYDPYWESRAAEAREWARLHYNNVVQDLIVHLKAVKPVREK